MGVLDKLDVSVDALAARCREFGVVELSAFGSVLGDAFDAESDIDLLVVFEPHLPVGLFHLLRLQHRLAGLLRRPVDLVPKAGLKPGIRDEVLARAQLVEAA
jgi:predicted nucleotidyltransferase